MVKYYKNNNNNPIVSQLKKNRLQKSDLCRLLNCSQATINNYIHDPGLIRFRDMHLMASVFNLGILQFVDLINRNKPAVTKADKWFIESVVSRNKE